MERPCPGESVTLTCTVPSTAHQWNIPSLGITQSLLPRDEGRVFSEPPFQFTVTRVITGSIIISTATVNATADLDATLVLCQGGTGMEPDQNSTLNIIGEYCMLYAYKCQSDQTPNVCFHILTFTSTHIC